MATRLKNLQRLAVVGDMSSSPKAAKEEKLRQEGREEVLEWLREYGIVNYSIPEDLYFIYDKKSEMILLLPWGRSDVG